MRIAVEKGHPSWGIYWDKGKMRLYLLPVPFLGIRLDFLDWRP